MNNDEREINAHLDSVRRAVSNIVRGDVCCAGGIQGALLERTKERDEAHVALDVCNRQTIPRLERERDEALELVATLRAARIPDHAIVPNKQFRELVSKAHRWDALQDLLRVTVQP